MDKSIVFFYRAMLCISKMSVRLSYSGIMSKGLNVFSNFFALSGNFTILVLPYQMLWQYFDGTPPLTGASNAGVLKIAIFDRYLALVI